MKHDSTVLYWTAVDNTLWPLFLIASPTHLVYVGQGSHPDESCQTWLQKHWPHTSVQRADHFMRHMAEQFQEYSQNRRRNFTVSLHFSGTPFQKKVWHTLCTIPYGQTCSYADVATRIGRARAVRAVATAIGANPMPIIVPCHRVIGKDGSLTGFGWGVDKKQTLLQLEGINM